MFSSSALLLFCGLIAGAIDSIAGGGGLITLPALSLVLGPGMSAVATNKIPGTGAALTALLVYLRAGHMDWRRSLGFAGFVAFGSATASGVAHLVPHEWYRWFLFITCPVILLIVMNRNHWIEKRVEPNRGKLSWRSLVEPKVAASGLACGFYDGIWGPGGGTFMFLSLLLIAKLPLLSAIAASKLANTFSAGTALAGYSAQGAVHWDQGVFVGIGVCVGAFIGAKYATQQASRIVRPTLVIVVILLLTSLLLKR